jgi:hypothetical protein
VHVVLGDDLRQGVDPTGDRDAVDGAVPQGGSVVDRDHRSEAQHR